MPDQTIKCKDCQQDFVLTEGEQKFFKFKGLNPPLRCKPCRAIKKQQNAQQDNQSPRGGRDKGWDGGNEW